MTLNSNLVHNVCNVASLILAAVTGALLQSGCAALPNGSFDCSSSWINPAWTTGAIAALQVLKIAINIGRDGLSGLTKPQPPVQK